MGNIKSVCVFCGSKLGSDHRYSSTARDLGRAIANENITLVYGGGSIGLMGEIATSVLDAGGQVIGVIPEMLATKELLHPGVEDMRLVKDMHSRKSTLSNLSDAFIALPGGYGTLEELFEVITWAQLGIHAKPIGLLNVNSYFNPLIQLIDHAVEEEFIEPEHRRLILTEENPHHILERLRGHEMPEVRQWLKSDEI